MIEERQERRGNRTIAHTLIDFNRNYVINLFDYVAVCCKYLDTAQLKEVLEEKIKFDVENGNLQVFALIGLKSESGPRVIQNFIDRTGDLQTAAYVSAYIATALSSPGAESVSKSLTSGGPNVQSHTKKILHLRRFIQAYRNYLNSLQLWNVRATFDVSWNALHKTFSMLVTSPA